MFITLSLFVWHITASFALSAFENLMIAETNRNIEICLQKSLMHQEEIVWYVGNDFDVNLDWIWNENFNRTHVIVNEEKDFLKSFGIPFRHRIPTCVFFNISVQILERFFGNAARSKFRYVLVFDKKSIDLPKTDLLYKTGLKSGFYNSVVGIYENEKLVFLHPVKTVNGTAVEYNTNCRRLHFYSDIKHLKNYDLKVSWVPADPFVINPFKNKSGLFSQVIKLIAFKSQMNLNFDLDTADLYEEFISKGTMKKLTNTLIIGKSDVVIGHTFANWSSFEYGPIFYNDQIIIGYYKRKQVASLKQLSRVLRYFTWLAIIVTYFVVVGIFSKGLYKSGIGVIIDMLFQILQITINMSVTMSLRLNWARILFLFYSFYSLLVMTIYKAQLSSIFSETVYDPPIETYELFYVKNITTKVNSYTNRLLSLDYHKNASEYLKALLPIFRESSYDLLQRTVNAQTDSCFVFESVLDIYPSHKNALDFILGKHLNLTYFNTFLMRKHSPVNKVINFWAQEIIEKGIFLKWRNDMRQSNVNVTLFRQFMPYESKNVVLTYAHYEQTFRILYLGLSVGIFVFVSEFFIKYIFNKIDWMVSKSPF